MTLWLVILLMSMTVQSLIVNTLSACQQMRQGYVRKKGNLRVFVWFVPNHRPKIRCNFCRRLPRLHWIWWWKHAWSSPQEIRLRGPEGNLGLNSKSSLKKKKNRFLDEYKISIWLGKQMRPWNRYYVCLIRYLYTK